MRRREFIALLGGVAAAWPLAARAQQPSKVYRIGVLEQTSAAMHDAYFEAFRQGLREQGFVEGQNLLIEYRSPDDRTERYPGLAAELVRLNVDLILTRGTPAVLAAKNATTTIPVVMAAIGDPLPIVAGLAQPGGNVTGLSAFNTELEAKRVELIRDVVPGLRGIGGLYNMGNPIFAFRFKELEKVAQLLGIEAHLLDVRKSEDLGAVFDTASERRVDALVVSADGVLQANRKRIAELAVMHRLPAIYTSREFIDVGGLISYGASYRDLYRRAATYVVKILKGTKPADLPVEQPAKFELVINLKTAKALGLEIPPMLLAVADEVIE
jgi:putative tryptophan/tyrosine transport system substrate-binding protein